MPRTPRPHPAPPCHAPPRHAPALAARTPTLAPGVHLLKSVKLGLESGGCSCCSRCSAVVAACPFLPRPSLRHAGRRASRHRGANFVSPCRPFHHCHPRCRPPLSSPSPRPRRQGLGGRASAGPPPLHRNRLFPGLCAPPPLPLPPHPLILFSIFCPSVCLSACPSVRRPKARPSAPGVAVRPYGALLSLSARPGGLALSCRPLPGPRKRA